MSIRHLCAVILMIGSLVSTAAAQEDDRVLTTRDRIDVQLTEYRDRLDLSGHQWTQVEQVLKSGIRHRMAIIERYGIDGETTRYADLERKQQRQLRRELKTSREDTDDRVKRYLDKDQFKEFKAIQEEVHDRIMDEARAREE